ncbi:head-tail adaptor protein [Brevundimonas sp.]|uniref:head-tail adaptor protein n=1 Tax=Brevundimonas sp. TaxID=1871086 RepID=UPI0022CC4502|nr:head-tail adaptor protein [Brevundimonas sp.]MCZ8194509.1 phage head-tail adapter protein [Brevundimonas sp.]
MTPPRRLAEVLEPVEAETPYGGRSVSYQPLGWTWVALAPRARRTGTEAGRDAGIETTTAETRADARLQVGRRLRLADEDWEIVTLDGISPGRVRLGLERRR